MTRNRLLLLMCSFLLLSGAAYASSACVNGQTLAYYEVTSGGVCSVGIVNFDFANAYIFDGDDYNPTAADVTVNIVGTGTSVGQQVGFTFTNNGYVNAGNNTDPFSGSPTCCEAGSAANPSGTGWVATNPDASSSGNSADLNMTFSASINPYLNPNLELYSTTTTLGVFIYSSDGGGTYATLGEPVTNTNDDSNIGNISLFAYGTGSPTGSAYFSPTDGVNVNKDIFLSATFANTIPNSVALNSLTETFAFTDTIVPEPGSLVLVGFTALLLGAWRWRKVLLGGAALVALLMTSVPRANASGLCISATMASYETAGYYCTIGGDVFSNFSYTVGPKTGNAAAPSQASPAFTVSPISSFGTAGFRFQPVVQTNGGASGGTIAGTISITISFDVTVGENLQNPGVATTDSASVSGSGTFAGSNLTVKEGASTLGTVAYPSNGSSPSPGSCCSGITTGSTLLITNTFDLDAPRGSSSNITHLSNLTDTLDETVGTPEPVGMLLLGSGILGLALLGRRRAGKRG